jgi:hypothetical protein
MWLAIRKQKERKLRPWGFRLAGAFFPTAIFFALAIVAGGPGAQKFPTRLPPPNFGALVPFPHDVAGPEEGRAAATPTGAATPDSAASTPQSASPTIVPALNADGLADVARLAELGPREFETGYKAAAAAGQSGLAWIFQKTPLAGADLSALTAAAALYQKGDVAGGDAFASRIDDPLQRLAPRRANRA